MTKETMDKTIIALRAIIDGNYDWETDYKNTVVMCTECKSNGIDTQMKREFEIIQRRVYTDMPGQAPHELNEGEPLDILSEKTRCWICEECQNIIPVENI